MPRISNAPGRIAASASLQSPGTGNAVAVAVEVAVVLSVAVLVDAVLERIGRAREDAARGVVAVDGRAEAVAVVVRAALALGDDVGEVVVDPVVAGAAGDPLGDPVARDDHVVAALAEVLVDAGVAAQRVAAVAAGEHVVAAAAASARRCRRRPRRRAGSVTPAG